MTGRNASCPTKKGQKKSCKYVILKHFTGYIIQKISNISTIAINNQSLTKGLKSVQVNTSKSSMNKDKTFWNQGSECRSTGSSEYAQICNKSQLNYFLVRGNFRSLTEESTLKSTIKHKWRLLTHRVPKCGSATEFRKEKAI